jgi:MFS family permease
VYAAGVRQRPKIFYGWWIVASLLVTLFFGAGIGASHSVFFKPIAGEFGWSRTALSMVLGLSAAVGGLCAPLWGRMIDTRGGRVILPIGAVLLGVSLLLLSRMNTLWQAYAFYSLLALGGGGMSLIPMSSVISHWFVSRRGLAMGTTLIGAGLGGMVMAPVAGIVAEELGWRTGYWLYGLALCLIVFPLLILVVRHRPQQLGLLPDGQSPESDETTHTTEEALKDLQPLPSVGISAALRTRTFWLIAIGFMLPSFSIRAIFVHLVPLITDLGISPRIAATAYGVIAGLGVAGRVGFGYAADRFSTRRIYALCYAIGAVGMLFLIGIEAYGTTALIGFILIFGCSYGGVLSLAPLLIGECFGIASMGVIFGGLGVAAMVGGALGPIFAGWVYDTQGSYHFAFIVFVFAQLIAIAAIYGCRPVIGDEASQGPGT